MKVGMPVMKLHAENINAVIREAWLRDNKALRNCSDPDYRPDLTAENVYLLGSARATDIIQSIEERKQTYETSSGRKMRKDAVLAIAGIIKPNGEQFRHWSQADQLRFFQNSLEILQGKDFFNGQLTSFVVQVDEGIPHAHWTAIPIASDGRWSAKKVLNLRMLNKLNTLYPETMKANGWDVEALASFDEDAYKAMSAEEKAAFLEAKKAKKAAHGLSSSRFKAEKEAVRIREEAAEKAAEVIEQAEAVAEQVKEEVDQETARTISETLSRIDAYESDRKAEIDAKVKIYAERQKAALQVRLEAVTKELAKANAQLAVVKAEKRDAEEDFKKWVGEIPDSYEVTISRALDVLLHWIPAPVEAMIRRGLDWILSRHRETGYWPIRREGAARRWPGVGKDREQGWMR